jgi:hypothetical protein
VAPRPNAVKSILEALGKSLKAAMPSLQAVGYEFPAPNVGLKYPSLTILAGNPVFTPLDPYLLEQSDTEGHKASVARVVGSYDLTLQLDLWCRDKVERANLWEEFFAAINPEITPMGLSLQLDGYYGIWCRYDLTGYALDDSEVSSQRGEWRARINVLANTRAVLEKTEFVIDTIENNLTTPDTI